MYTIGELGKQFGLSRSTLIYYDKIGLLTPSGRSEGNYRLYTPEDCKRMEKIAIYKNAGLSLEAIQTLLDYPDTDTTALLEQRLAQINADISALRSQQQALVQLLGKDSMLRHTKVMTKEQWVAILEASGMDKEARRQWHAEFERTLPEAHTDFLESLGIPADEIAEVKARSLLES